LDPHYGAGLLNVDQSWLELKAGNQTALTSSGSNSNLQPNGNLRLAAGWDLGSLPDGNTTNHYFFTAPVTGGTSDTFTATIDWNVSQWDASDNAIFNNLDLALYDTANTSSPVSVSDSTVDNVQELYAQGLVPGHTYDLRVYESASLAGGATTYGLAYAIVPEPSTVALLFTAGICGLAIFVRGRLKGHRT
jgi:hypothetical protein